VPQALAAKQSLVSGKMRFPRPVLKLFSVAGIDSQNDPLVRN
jgi:hypothetical protein